MATLPAQASARDAHDTILALRREALRNLLLMTLVGTIVWYTWHGIRMPPQNAPDQGLLIVPMLGLEVACLALVGKHYRGAALLFLGGALALVTVSTHLFAAPEATFLYPLLALAAVVILGTAAGCTVAAIGAGLAALLTSVGDAPLREAVSVGLVALASLLTVGVAWTLSRNFRLAIEWSLTSYHEALANLTTARERRAEVLRLNQELGRARERLERANAALVRAWRTAEEAERRQQQMTACISHEMRTPLNLVIGFSEMMVTSPETYALETLPPKVRRDLHAIYRSAQQVAALIDDVLDMASADAGQLALVRQPTDLWPVIAEATDLMRDYIEGKNLALLVEQEGSLPPVLMDRLRIRQVLLNLLINAARFTDQGFIRIHAICTGDHLRVTVQDTGRGIPPDRLERVFEDFQSTESLGSLRGRGTGLGLPLSQRLVRLHGGEMSAHSVPEQGTTLCFTLPLAPDAIQASAPTLVSSSASAHPSPGAEPTLVLWDEDEIATHRLRRRLEGYHLVGAPSWSAALHQAVELHALALIADSAALPDTGPLPCPLIRCPLPSRRRWAARLGVAQYLPKPVNAAQVIRTLSEVAPHAQTVLIVDDDGRFVQLMARILESTGRAYRLDVAHTGEEALEKLRSIPPDVVLLDMALPVLDGREVLARKAQDPRTADIPVIVVSAPPAEEELAPLAGAFTLQPPDGLRRGDVVRLLEATLAALPARAPGPNGAAPP